MRLQIVLLSVFVTLTNGYKILVLQPYTGKSHFEYARPLIKTLLDEGHQITTISHFSITNASMNYTNIQLKNPTEIRSADLVHMAIFEDYPYIQEILPALIGLFSIDLCEHLLTQTNVREFVNSDQHFDIVIAELFADYCFMGLVKKLNAPLVGISSCMPISYLDKHIAYPNSPSYVPNIFSSFSHEMNFFERLKNSMYYWFVYLVFNVYAPVYYNRLTERYIGKNLPAVEDIMSSASVMLVNSHYSITGSRSLPPGYVETAGLHIGKAQKLPMHIDKWINESKHGVIYFSLGSMIKGHTFPEEKKQMFINAFSRLPQRVLWKWENETMLGKTDNIMIEKWMPQFDILCHPNVKVFIAHGGMLGVTEAVHCGVPMIIMPQFGDQFTNAKAVEASGGGLILDYRYLDEESIYKALTTALDPKSYKNAKELSARFKDRPMPPLETAIYWIEYVARHGGAPHLRTAAVGMPLYQYLLLDVIAFLAFILFSFIFIVYYITRAVLRRFCGSKKSTKKVKKN